MVYKERFVAVVKCNGKILRDKNQDEEGIVYLPFGSEYSLLFKNLEKRKVQIKVSIDNQDVLCGNSLVIDGNSTVELERFLENYISGHKFKFIQKTNEIIDHRGDKIDDGFIRIEFQFEAQQQETIHYNHIHHDIFPIWSRPYDFPYNRPYIHCSAAILNDNTQYGFNVSSGMSSRGMSSGSMTVGNGESVANSYNSSQKFESGEMRSCNTVNTQSVNNFHVDVQPEEGITVKGSESQQRFYPGYIGKLEQNANVIILRLKGIKNNGTTKIDNPVTIKTKLECITCGKKNDSKNKFCSNCGTSLD